MSKEIPMMFSEPMVIALGNDTKTETRRTRGLDEINKHPDKYKLSYFGPDPLSPTGDFIAVFWKKDSKSKKPIVVKFPYGKPGDVIWVREMFSRHFMWKGSSLKEWRRSIGVDNTCFFYKDGSVIGGCDNSQREKRWWPSIHMPREAARTFLQIVDIGIEPLHNIHNGPAISEGIECWLNPLFNEHRYKDYSHEGDNWRSTAEFRDPVSSYKSLWESINGAGSWDNNPFVWIIRFKKLPNYGEKINDTWAEATINK